MTHDETLPRLKDEIAQRRFVRQLRKRAAALDEEDWIDLDDVE